MTNKSPLLLIWDDGFSGYRYYKFKDSHNKEIVTIGIIPEQYAKNDMELILLEQATRTAFLLMRINNEEITPQTMLARMIAEFEKLKENK